MNLPFIHTKPVDPLTKTACFRVVEDPFHTDIRKTNLWLQNCLDSYGQGLNLFL